MPRKRFAELEEPRRDRILGTAAREFAERGYEAASVNRIIADAGISKGSLYYYFDDKEDLFATVLEHAATQVMEDLGMPPEDDLTADNFWPTFRDLMRRSVEYLQTNEWYVRFTRSFHNYRSAAPDSPAIRRVMDMGRAQLSAFLERGQTLGVVRTDLPLPLLVEVALAVDEAGDRWRIGHWEEFSRDERAAQADAQSDLVRDMLHAKNQGWEE